MTDATNSRFEQAVAAFARANAEDPQQLLVDGQLRPRELVQAERLATWVLRLEPNASLALRLASHCQHIRRWQSPRSAYPAGRLGYLQWRTQLARFHADTAAEILQTVGYDGELLLEVRRINLKQNLQGNPDSRTMEDALCLAFLEFEFAEFITKYDESKVIEVVQKTWKKMSPRGHEFALGLPLSGAALELVRRALGSAG